jgi:hypothetical protein
VERAKSVPLDEQPAEMDASRETSVQTGPVDTQSTGAVPVPKGQAKIVPTETALPDTQSVGRQSSDGPQVKPNAPGGKFAAVEGRLFRSLLRRGLIVAMFMHFVYELVQQLSRYSDESYSEVPFLPLPGMRWLRYRCEIEDGFVTISVPSLRILDKITRRKLRVRRKLDEDAAAILPRVLVVFSVGIAVGLTILCALPFYVIWAGFRALSATFRLALVSTPILLAILVVVFSTGDAWRLYGNESIVRFSALMVILLVVAFLALYRVVARQADGWRQVVTTMVRRESVHSKLVDKTKAAEVAAAGVTPADMTGDEPFDILARYNANVLYWLNFFGQLLAMALWVSLMFIILGVIIVSNTAAHELLGSPPDVLWKFPLFGQSFVVSQQLLLLSGTLGAVAALTFATLGLQDDHSRQDFFNRSQADLRQGLAMLSYYVGGVRGRVDLLSEQDWRLLSAIIKSLVIILAFVSTF